MIYRCIYCIILHYITLYYSVVQWFIDHCWPNRIDQGHRSNGSWFQKAFAARLRLGFQSIPLRSATWPTRSWCGTLGAPKESKGAVFLNPRGCYFVQLWTAFFEPKLKDWTWNQKNPTKIKSIWYLQYFLCFFFGDRWFNQFLLDLPRWPSLLSPSTPSARSCWHRWPIPSILSWWWPQFFRPLQ